MTLLPAPWHTLRPFEAAAGPERVLAAAVEVLRTPGQIPQLQLRYVLQNLEDLRVPALSASPARRDELWQHTCFEAFVAVPDQEPYWEFNLSPSADWAAYHLSSYRQGLQPEWFFTRLPVAIHAAAAAEGSTTAASTLTLELSCSLPPKLAAASTLQVGLTAVLESNDGSLSYWALNHPGREADFHDRRGWMFRV